MNPSRAGDSQWMILHGFYSMKLVIFQGNLYSATRWADSTQSLLDRLLRHFSISSYEIVITAYVSKDHCFPLTYIVKKVDNGLVGR